MRSQVALEAATRSLKQRPFFAYLSENDKGDFVFDLSQKRASRPLVPPLEVESTPHLLISLLALGAIVSFLFSLTAFVFSHVPILVDPLNPHSAMTTPEMALITAEALMVVAVVMGATAYLLRRGLLLQPARQAETVRQHKHELQPLLNGLRSARGDEQQQRAAQALTQQTWRRLTDKRHKVALLHYLYQQQLIVNQAVISLRDLDLSGLDLAKYNLRAIDLSATNLQKTRFGHANLAEANLRAANLTDADLRSANLRDAVLNDVILDRTNLTNATLTLQQLGTVKSQRQVTL